MRDLEIRKFKREEIAFALLAKANIPAPKVIWLDESRTILNADILITERLPGDSHSKYWKNLGDEARTNLVEASANILFSIHKIKVESFGPLDTTSKKYLSWNDYLGECLQDFCQKVSTAKIFDNQTEIERKVWTAFKKVEPLLALVLEPKLLHGDFHFANLIGIDSKISGVVDFEWSIGGDPEMDFRNPTNINDSANGSESLLAAEYQKLNKAQFNKMQLNVFKNDFYRMLIKLELMPISLTHWVGKIAWGADNHRQIMKTFELTLHRLISTEIE